MSNCNTCAWFLNRDHCRDDLKAELENSCHEGYCVERTNNFFFMPMIPHAASAKCGKWEARLSCLLES